VEKEVTNNMRGAPLILIILQLAIASSFLPLVLGTTYVAGVSPGNYVKFEVSESHNSNDPSLQTERQFLKNIDNTAFLRADVENVSGTNVIYKMTQSFNNGTLDKVMTLLEDVNTGGGNATSGGFHYVFVAGGLGYRDKVSNDANAPTIDYTATRAYAGASRDVNLYEAGGPVNENYSLTANQYWDRASGVLTELSFSANQKSGSSGQYTTTWSDLLILTETNIWAASTAGYQPAALYEIIGAIGAIVATVSVVVALRMRKTKAVVAFPPQSSPQPSISPTLSGLVQCSQCNGYNLPGAGTCRHCGVRLLN
jgi:hypothetical protein